MSRRRKPLTDEDRALWNAVKDTAIPLHKTPKAEPIEPLAEIKPPAKPRRKIVEGDLKIGHHGMKPPKHNLAPTLSEGLATAPLNMDRKKYAKMNRGKLSPEARIDLHGMTLAQAQPALTRFILNSWALDRRLVLVITGKGKHRDDGGPIPVRHGVLKHQVPHWLHSTPLREAVLQVSEAHLKHGGTGAYYVYLRRQR